MAWPIIASCVLCGEQTKPEDYCERCHAAVCEECRQVEPASPHEEPEDHLLEIPDESVNLETFEDDAWDEPTGEILDFDLEFDSLFEDGF